jgi:transcriptional regulator with XRE-family HTH domain
MALSQDQALASIKKKIDGEGSQLAFARKHGLSPAYISDVLTGRRDPSKAILDAVGLERVVTYRKKDRPDA